MFLCFYFFCSEDLLCLSSGVFILFCTFSFFRRPSVDLVPDRPHWEREMSRVIITLQWKTVKKKTEEVQVSLSQT